MTTIDTGITRDGLVQARRRWPAPESAVASILLIHGLGEHSGRYEHVGSWLSDAGYDVVAIDQRGFGRSGGARGDVASFDRYLDDVEDQLVEVRSLGKPVVLLGHSMGGLVCTDYATSERPQPDLLVLSAPALAAKIPAPLRVLAPRLARLTPRLRVKGRIDPTVLSRDRLVQEAYVNDPLVTTFVTARMGAALMARGPQVVARLGRLRVPTLCLHGAEDHLVPPSASACLDGLPGVERGVLSGLRHEILNEPEYPEVLLRIVEWIEAHAS